MSTEESDDQRADDLVRKQDADRALEYASLGRRLVAFALDFAASILAVMVPVWIIMRLLLAAGVWTPVFPDSSGETTWLVMGIGPRVLVVIAFYLSTGPLYFVLCESSAWQATIGKTVPGHLRDRL